MEHGTRKEADEQEEQDTLDDESEGELQFEPFDINNDGRIIKTASQCSRGSWKRPEAGWDVSITVHRFCELSPSKAAPGEDSQEHKVEPELLQLAFKLGEDEEEGFPQVTKADTAASTSFSFFGVVANKLDSAMSRATLYLLVCAWRKPFAVHAVRSNLDNFFPMLVPTYRDYASRKPVDRS